MNRLAVLVLMLAWLFGWPASAQAVAERELEICKTLFDTGKYGEARTRSISSMATLAFTDAQKIELFKLAAVSSFNLGESDTARQFFLELLRLNPDFELDPFRFAPPAIKLFESVKKANATELDRIRQQIIAARERALAESKAKQAEEAKRRIEAAGASVVVRTVNRPSLIVNFLPFGLGQFQQQRTALGVGFAVSEGVLAVASIVAFWAIEGLFEEVVYELPDRVTADNQPFRLTLRRIPERRKSEVAVWRAIKYGAGAGFFAAWIGGAVDALLHHVTETVVETKQTPGLRARLQFAPNAHGATAALTFEF